jgi:ATP-dependent DNA helicase RecG
MPTDELLQSLLAQHESEYIEFKGSNFDPDNIGQLISALANGAVLQKKDEAYLVYGISDDRKIVGTTFDPGKLKKNNQPFKNWLSSNLEHAGSIDYCDIEIDSKKVVILVIPRATAYPVTFKGAEYIRIGEAKKKLSEHPEIARKLWEEILRVSFEDGHASDLLDETDVFDLIDIRPYFKLRDEPVPDNSDESISHLISDNILVPKLGKYYITNLGALLFAKKFEDFDSMFNRGVRLIRYKGNDKSVVDYSIDGNRGYAIGINELLRIVMLLLPQEEYLDESSRRITRAVYPRSAVRELIINMLLHQDFSVSGYAPRIEIYADRIEFTNPGAPVIEVARFLDLNLSRNPKLARVMRFMKLTEERGMGIDTVEIACESKYLPSPAFMASEGFTRVTIFDHKTLRQFNSTERVNLVYMHCCLQHVKHMPMTNESLRSRFATDRLSSIVASRWINEALERKLVRPFDPDSASRRHASYVPFWA